MKVWKDFNFEAAHSLPDDRMGGPNARMHGHSYMARVYIEGEPGEGGMVVHMDDLERAIFAVRFRLDHMNLNEILSYTHPTLEKIAEFIAVSLPALNVVRVDVWRPTCSDGAIWERGQ
jgi:6-pyruvoyltetrahydropterin/6-carboxytetrahydropterin synthase